MFSSLIAMLVVLLVVGAIFYAITRIPGCPPPLIWVIYLIYILIVTLCVIEWSGIDNSIQWHTLHRLP